VTPLTPRHVDKAGRGTRIGVAAGEAIAAALPGVQPDLLGREQMPQLVAESLEAFGRGARQCQCTGRPAHHCERWRGRGTAFSRQ
jgi:hypothetical protein